MTQPLLSRSPYATLLRIMLPKTRGAKPVIDHNNLEEFQDPINYDLEEIAGSKERIAFYCQLAEAAGSPVLEIACGTGIVALSMAAQGLVGGLV